MLRHVALPGNHDVGLQHRVVGEHDVERRHVHPQVRWPRNQESVPNSEHRPLVAR